MLKYKLKEQNEEDTQDDRSWGESMMTQGRRTRDTREIMGDKSNKKNQTKVSSDYVSEDITK